MSNINMYITDSYFNGFLFFTADIAHAAFSKMSSFFIVMTSNRDDFNGTIYRHYDRPFRLSGEWEVALKHLKFQEHPWPVLVFCDLVEYTHVDNTVMHFLDYYDTQLSRNSRPQYVKVIRKLFSSINVNIRNHKDNDDLTGTSDVT